MSKETIKMNSIRITRIGIKKALCDAEWAANCHRNVLRENWNKDDDKEVRKALNKAHRGLAKARKVINECQSQLRATKHELRKLNHQHDIRTNAINEHINGYNQTGLLG
jgi:uncharacterized coiled-coil DUF342 family protein